MKKVVGIGEMIISNNIEDSIKTFALASCVAVVVYSPLKKIGGMIHIALPNPPSNEDKIMRKCYYASTGVPHLINTMCNSYGCIKEELKISLYGGANSIRIDDVFNIGRKNLDIIKKILNQNNLRFTDVETGKNVSRTIELNMLTGEVTVSCQQIKI